MPQKINLAKKLENFYGTIVYHRVSNQLVLTDGTEALLDNIDDDFNTGIILQEIHKRLNKVKEYGILFLNLIFKDNKIMLRFYDDIPERGHHYNYKEELYADRFNDSIDFMDCEIKTFIQNGVWALLSEY